MEVIPVRTRLARVGEDLYYFVAKAIKEAGIELRDGDVIAVASKLVSTCRGRVVNYSRLKPSREAEELAKRHGLDASFVELVLKEAGAVLGGMWMALLTAKDGILTVNAGADRKNAPEGCVALWPHNANEVAAELARHVKRRLGVTVGIVIVDSGLIPLRRGTVGLAIGIANVKPIADYRGKKDIYGKPILMTSLDVADSLATAAHLVMGEGDELTPIAVIRGAPIEVVEDADASAVKMRADECVFVGGLGLAEALMEEFEAPEKREEKMRTRGPYRKAWLGGRRIKLD